MSDKKKGGKAFIVVGGTGMGKTTWIKNQLAVVHPDTIFLHDVNNEYTEFYNKPFLPSFDLFAAEAKEKKHMVIVYEEATVFLSNRGSNTDLIEALVGKRHTYVVIFLVFHSLRAVPKYLLDLCNYVVLHKTNDPLAIVEKLQNESITKAYLEIKAAEMITAHHGGTISPHKIISLL